MKEQTKRFQLITLFIYLLFNAFFLFSQEEYNHCINALDLCPNVTTYANNIKADKTLCQDCEDDLRSSFCFSSSNSVWFKFYTNSTGGDISIICSNINYLSKPNQTKNLNASILQAKVPCDASTYTQLGNCILNTSNSFAINASNLNPNETFYLVIAGNLNPTDQLPAEASFELSISGTGVSRQIPSISIETPKQKICKNELVNFSCYSSNCKDSSKFHWYLNDSLISITDSSTLTYAKLTSGDKLKVSNSCFTSCPFIVQDSTIIPNVISFPVNAGNDTTVNAGDLFRLNGQTTVDSVRWTPYNYLSDTVLKNPMITPTKSMYYQFTGIKDGCLISDLIYVHVIQPDNVPSNSFSPNGDGINDVWEIPFLEDFPNCHVQIYSRWGQTVFETTGYSFLKSWDGRYNGKLVDAGTYFYVIHLQDNKNREPIKGSLTIVR